MSVDKILAERQKTHGEFETHAAICQKMKAIARGNGLCNMDLTQAEGLEMILHKIARILNGNPGHIDHWDDIAGYATLVANHLRKGKANINV